MEAIARRVITDVQVMEALMPGSTGGDVSSDSAPPQREAISIRGLTPGVAFDLAPCCHPVPGDRIVGLRREDEPILVHAIDCPELADGVDADWVDLAWGDGSDGGTARLSVILKNEPGALAVMAGIFGTHKANILNLRLEQRDASFHGFKVDLEVHDLQHLTRIVAALRAADAVSQAERA
jgi:(p)ppGpp synthase/HD superfamily hydrolase